MHDNAKNNRVIDLTWNLAWRDIRVRYKQSLLGILWALLLPMVTILIFTFVFSKAIDTSKIFDVKMPYALYAYVGLAPWIYFSNSITGAVQSLVSNRNLITKVYFPREVFPVSCVVSGLVDFLISLVVLVGLGIYFHATGQWVFEFTSHILIVPIIFLFQIMFMTGLGMIFSMANLFYRDVRQVVTAGLQLLMFLSNVIIPLPTEGTLGAILAVNPLVHIFDAYRKCLISHAWPSQGAMIYLAVSSTIVMAVGLVLFHRKSYRFAECI